VAVPEAAVDKNHRLVLWQNNVGLAGELFVLRAVDGETIAHGVQEGAHDKLGLRVFAADAAHVPGAALGREAIVQFSIWDLACYHFQTRLKKEPLMDKMNTDFFLRIDKGMGTKEFFLEGWEIRIGGNLCNLRSENPWV
jgi:hypothetical protein